MTRTCLLHISANRYPPFPASHHTRRIWDELAIGFDEYHVFARSERNHYIHSVDGKIHLHLMPAIAGTGWMFFLLSWALPWLMLRYRPTHLLAQCPVQGGLAAAACAKLFGVPLLVELHGAQYFRNARCGWLGAAEFLVYRSLSRITFAAADRIRTLSEDMRDNLEHLYGSAVAGKSVMVPNRVDLGVFSAVKQSYAVDGDLRVITVGSFFPRKNHVALIEDLFAAGISFRLTLVGAGALAEEYRRVATRLGIHDRVHLVENASHPQLARLLPAHDVYIHYAISEGVPRAVLEAMAAGLPVITTAVGFIKGVLHDGYDALLLKEPWRAELATAIRAVAKSEAVRRRLGENARRAVEERFEWNRVFERYRAAILETRVSGR